MTGRNGIYEYCFSDGSEQFTVCRSEVFLERVELPFISFFVVGHAKTDTYHINCSSTDKYEHTSIGKVVWLPWI